MTREEAIRHLTSLRIHSQNRQLSKDIEALDKAIEVLEQEPPIAPLLKVGRWILTDVEGIEIWHCNCSECGKGPQNYIYGTENWWLIKNNLPKFCPTCGAKMEVENDT